MRRFRIVTILLAGALLTLACGVAFWLTFQEPPAEAEAPLLTEPASDLPPIIAEEAQ